MKSAPGVPVRRITAGLIGAWVFSSLFFLLAILFLLVSPFGGWPAAGVAIIFLLLGALLSPPANRKIREWWNIEISPGLKAFILLAGIICVGVLLGNSSPVVDAEAGGLSDKHQDLSSELAAWGRSLPTEYVLGNVTRICTEANCSVPRAFEQTAFARDAAEGYSISFRSEGQGRAYVYRFPTRVAAQESYILAVEKIKNDRGYSAVDSPDSCFAWGVNDLYSAYQMVCGHDDRVSWIGLEGMLVDEASFRQVAGQLDASFR